MLLEKIKLDALEARRARKTDTAILLTTLLSEASMVGKNDGNRVSTDAEVIAVIEKFVKNANEVQRILLDAGKNTANVVSEILILNSYLPQKLTFEELTELIFEIIEETRANGLQMGKIMSVLKNSYSGKYDGKVASALVKRCLAERGE